jgi:signal transduction histidine kinase
MHINLVTADADLHNLCLEVLAELGGHHTFSTERGEVPGCDVYICDLDSNLWSTFPVQSSDVQHLFVVDRKNLTLLQRDTIPQPNHLLLKPVTCATLSAFLTVAVNAKTQNSLRSDRDEILQCLIQANLKLQEYDQERTNFLARAMHDFRAPLTALNGYCGLLLAENLGCLTEEQSEVLRRMQHSAHRLSRMASTMFQLSVGRQIKRRPDLREGSIRNCIDQALHEIAPFIDEKTIEVSVDFTDPAGLLYFEPDQVEQVLVNILHNACKFTPRGGYIELRSYPVFWERRHSCSTPFGGIDRRRHTSVCPNAYRIDIQDSGAPIAENRLVSIFQEYTSYSDSRDRSGGGLGLAVCKLIMSQHEGTVWAHNAEAGPIFSIVLPIHSVESVRSEDYILAEVTNAATQ